MCMYMIPPNKSLVDLPLSPKFLMSLRIACIRETRPMRHIPKKQRQQD
jgi:hypothetical protein